LGKRAGVLLGGWAEKIGGVVLIAIGLRILVQHLTQ
jgi:putative Mn2+ efflux pump MntP